MTDANIVRWIERYLEDMTQHTDCIVIEWCIGKQHHTTSGRDLREAIMLAEETRETLCRERKDVLFY